MVKEKKVFVRRGAPLYMAQFTMIMLILIVFFMIMVTLNKSQEGVGKSGVAGGEVPNPLNLNMESIGMFQFGRAKVRKQYVNPKEDKNKIDSDLSGQDRSLSEGSGGLGDTDVALDPKLYGSYIKIKLKDTFAKGSANITPEMAADLKKVGMILSMWEAPFSIKCRTTENPDIASNFNLAFKRALQIMRFFYLECNISYDKMESSGMVFDRYLKENTAAKDEKGEPGSTGPTVDKGVPKKESSQENYLFIFIDPSKAKKD